MPMPLAAVNGLQMLAIIFGLSLGAVLFLICLSISAAVLKLACRTAGAEVPDTGKAMVVSFLESVAGSVIWLLSCLSVSVAGIALHAERATMSALVGLSAVNVAFVVPAALYVPMLRVSFQKGLLISILRYVITLSFLAIAAFAIIALTGKHRMR
jgi:hypothetical protein